MTVRRLRHPSESFDLSLPEGKPFDVVGFGLNSTDQLCIVPEYPGLDSKCGILQYAKLPGGQVATAVIFLSRMGLKTKYVGKVGEDDFGRMCLENLEREAVDVRSVRIEDRAINQFSIIIIDRKSGERTVLCHLDSRLDFTKPELEEEDLCSGRILHLDGYDASSLQAARWCRKRGIPVCADLDAVVPDCEALMEHTDFLIVSAGFPSAFTGIRDPDEAFRTLKRGFGGFLAMTLGKCGARAFVGDRCVLFPALDIEAVDTTGAGDVFHGAFIYGLLQNWTLNKIMAFANAAAGLSCRHLGAQSGIRPLAEILQNMNGANP